MRFILLSLTFILFQASEASAYIANLSNSGDISIHEYISKEDESFSLVDVSEDFEALEISLLRSNWHRLSYSKDLFLVQLVEGVEARRMLSDILSEKIQLKREIERSTSSQERVELMGYLKSLEKEAFNLSGFLAFEEIYWDEDLKIYVIHLAPLPEPLVKSENSND